MPGRSPSPSRALAVGLLLVLVAAPSQAAPRADGPAREPATRNAQELPLAAVLEHPRDVEHRMYDPVRGRFLQRDPVWDPGNVGNQYAFVGNGPVSRGDPWGLLTPDEVHQASQAQVRLHLQLAANAVAPTRASTSPTGGGGEFFPDPRSPGSIAAQGERWMELHGGPSLESRLELAEATYRQEYTASSWSGSAQEQAWAMMAATGGPWAAGAMNAWSGRGGIGPITTPREPVARSAREVAAQAQRLEDLNTTIGQLRRGEVPGGGRVTAGRAPCGGRGFTTTGRDRVRFANSGNPPGTGGLRGHARKHGEGDTAAYYQQAVENMNYGYGVRGQYEGQQTMNYLTRLGEDQFRFTATSSGGSPFIFTHHETMTTQGLRNLGITLPAGF